MKKFALAIALCFLFSLTACGSDNTEPIDSSEPQDTQSAPLDDAETPDVTTDASQSDETNQTDEADEVNETDQTDESSSAQTITFPSGTDELTEYNSDILDIPEFTLSITLPDGWTVSDEGDFNFPASLFSIKYILDDSGKAVGAMGYNIISSELSDEEKETPMAIYSPISLGNHYCFQVRYDYDKVSDADGFECALTHVYSSELMTGDEEKTDPGIVIYSLGAGAFVGIEFAADTPEETVRNIAESMAINA